MIYLVTRLLLCNISLFFISRIYLLLSWSSCGILDNKQEIKRDVHIQFKSAAAFIYSEDSGRYQHFSEMFGRCRNSIEYITDGHNPKTMLSLQ